MTKVQIGAPSIYASISYASGYTCMDAVMLVDHDDKLYGWFPSTEIEKAKKSSKVDVFYNLSDAIGKLKFNKKTLLKSTIIADWLRENGVNSIEVSELMPVIEADNLRNEGIDVRVIQEPLYKIREVKNESEYQFIKENSSLNCQVMGEIEEIIGASSVDNKKQLIYNNEILTSEFLQQYILKSFIDKGLFSDTAIVSIGDQCVDPHEYGKGPVYANQSIIVDIYPKNRYNYYYTDMTRTFCKGKVGDELKKLYNIVKEAQQLGIDLIRDGSDGDIIHQKIMDLFLMNNYHTDIIDGVLQGFFHGTGHGLGLECHESPYISSNHYRLVKGNVVSVEPGLYYLGIGGVRIEDLVYVTSDGCEVLTPYKKVLEVE